MRSIDRRVVIALLIAFPAAAQAQDWKAAQSDYKLRHWVKPPEEKTLSPDLPPAEAARFMGRINAIIERIAALPAFKTPRDERCHQVQAMYPAVQPDAPAPPMAEVEVKMYGWVRVSCLANDRFTEAGFTLHVNQPNYAFPLPSRSDAFGKFYQWRGELPKRGISHYENLVVAVRSDAPPLLPITKQRYLEHLIAKAEERVGEADKGQAGAAKAEAQLRNMPALPAAAELYEKWQRETRPRALATIEQWTKIMRDMKRPEQEITDGRAKMEADLARQEKSLLASVEREKQKPPQQRPAPSPSASGQAAKMRQADVEELESLRAQLAALSPEQRRAPACSPPDVRERFGGECGPRTTLVEVNPAFFDKAAPRGEIQLIVLRNSAAFDSPNQPKGAHNDLIPLWQAVRANGVLASFIK